MAYPPHGYPQQPPQYRQPGYPPPQYPPAPPPYPQYRQPYPPQQYAPMPQYAPAPQYPPPPPPPPKKQTSARVVLRTIAGVIGLALAAVFLVAALMDSEPAVGDCLASMEDHFWGGVEVVECSDQRAAWEVVNRTETGSTSNARASICEGYSDGESVVRGGKRDRLRWAICAVPR